MRLEDYDDVDNEVLDDTYSQLYDSLISGVYNTNKLKRKKIKNPKPDDYIMIEVPAIMRIDYTQVFASPYTDNSILVQFPLIPFQISYIKRLSIRYGAEIKTQKNGIELILN